MKILVIKKQKIDFFLLLLMVVIGVLVEFNNSKTIYTMAPVNKKVIVIDAGHGGWDPGKTGTNGLNEKDINLAIAQKLQMYLEQSGAIVFVTRNTDEALDKAKNGDMLSRKNIINGVGADVILSIHQNSFPQGGAKGAQVFYYEKSENGKVLAETLQQSLVENVDRTNKRLAKPNSNYYILKKSDVPAAIVECGFLSNSQEEKLLNTEQYQHKIAWAIYLGINKYFENISQ